MLVCPRCTTENAEGSAKCGYCAQVLIASAPSTGMVGWAAPGAPPTTIYRAASPGALRKLFPPVKKPAL
jgi:hypothetical protein